MLFITGMGRSGTSAVAGMIAALGVKFGKNLLRPAPENPKGFFEDIAFKSLNYEIIHYSGGDWKHPPEKIITSPEIEKKMLAFLKVCRLEPIHALKDPRLCLTLSAWKKFMKRMDVIFCTRPAAEICQSLSRVHGLTEEQGLELIAMYHKAFKDAYSKESIRMITVNYHELLADWRAVAERINARFNCLNMKRAARAEKFIDSTLYRCRGKDGNNLNRMA